jgi:hypothetical protein
MTAPAASLLRTGALGLCAFFLALAIHEGGHVLAGLAVGFRFRCWAAGPFFLVRDGRGRLRPGWNRDAFLWGGIGETVPIDTRGLLPRMAVVAIGGPAANLLLAAASTLALSAFGGALPAAGRIELSWLRLLSGLLFLGSLLPMKSGAFLTDGARAWRLLRGGSRATRDERLLELAARSSRGERPRDWSQASVESALVPPDGSLYELDARFWAYARAIDAGNVAGAAPHVRRFEELMGQLPASMRAPYACEVAWWDATHGGRAADAARLLAAIPASSPWLEPCDRLRAEAAIARAEARTEDAADAVKRALESAPLTASFCRARLEEMRTTV